MLKNKHASKFVATACALVMTVGLVGCNNPATPDMSKVVFEDQEFTYDGSAKTLEVKNLPDAYSYTFSIAKSSGEAVQPGEVVNVGSYVFTATFSANIAKVNVPDPMKATLTIVKGTYDMSDFQFNGLEVTYDGQAHRPAVSGVPSGVTATLKVTDAAGTELANGVTDAGSYKVTATFAGNDNYKAISAKEAYMVVKPAAYYADGIKVSDLAVTYDGKAHLPTVTGLPTGVSASYVVVKDGETTPTAAAIDAGTYHVTISFSGDNNHSTIASRTVDLVIGKATYDMSGVQITNLQHKYDGTAHAATVTGLPAGVSTTLKYYPGNSETGLDGATDVGTYKVVASFTGNANYEVIANKEAQLVIDKADYDMSKFAINDLEVVYDGNAHLPTVSGLPTGVTATVKLFSGETEVQSAVNAGDYKVVVSFAGAATHNAIANREATLKIAKASYDMSKFTINDLEVVYDGNAHLPTVSGLPTGVTADIKVFSGELQIASPKDAGHYNVVVSFTGDANYEAIANREATFIIGKSSNVVSLDVVAEPRTVNVDAESKNIALAGDLQGATPIYTYKDANGDVVSNINTAPVGEYNVDVMFEHPNYLINTVLNAKLTITNKIVKNISTYAELVAMAAESQANFTLYEADGINELTEEVDSWEQYNGGNPADRWANKVTYQLVNDIDCGGETWKAAGWQIGDYMKTEEKQIGGENVTVIQGTDYVVNVPRADGPLDYGFGYISLYLDGNGHSIKDLKLNNDTFSNTNGDELGQYPNFIDGGSYRKVGMFVSTAFSTFKDIVFEDPTMTIDDTSSTVVWAGFINATESQGNTYQGLTFNNPIINVNCKKSNIGGIAGITLALARQTDPAGIRGADYYLDRPEEMEINFQDVQFNNIDYTVTGINADRNSVGGLYGENQSANLTFNLNNVDINGDVNISNGTKNLAGDFFGYIAHKYQTKGYFVKDPDSMYKFNVDGCDTSIAYTMSGSNIHVGTSLSGDSYRLVDLKSEEYVASTYYKIAYLSNNFELAAGAYDANEYYFVPIACEVFDSYYFYIDCPVSYAWLLNYTVRVSNSTCTSSIAA